MIGTATFSRELIRFLIFNVLVNRSTYSVPFISPGNKTYTFTIKWTVLKFIKSSVLHIDLMSH